jgi:DNA-binding NarL/FixJ family response regulator
MRFLIIDDHTLFLDGISMILKGYVEGVQIDEFDSVRAFENSKIDIEIYHLIILDIEIPGEDTLGFAFRLKNKGVDIPILILTMHNKLAIIRKCKDMAVQGYLLKDDNEELLPAVQKLLDGGEYYSKKVTHTLTLIAEKPNILTIREEDVIRLVAAGKNDDEISDQLFISVLTVKTHKKNIKRKLNLTTTAQIVKYAFENNII